MSAIDQMRGQLAAAKAAVDAEFGDGYAAAHPDVVAACVQSAAIHTAVIVAKGASEETNRTLLQLKPRFFG